MHIQNLRYDTKHGAFKASVDIEHKGKMYRYPCEIHAPESLSHDHVIANLKSRASQISNLRN